MEQHIKVSIAIMDGQDGSQSIFIANTREECLEYLDRTEEQLEEGDTYNDGCVIDKVMIVDGGKLVKPLRFSTDG